MAECEQPKTCPFCQAGDRHLYVVIDELAKRRHIECDRCGARGPVAGTWGDAWGLWGARPEPAVSVAVPAAPVAPELPPPLWMLGRAFRHLLPARRPQQPGPAPHTV
jgi:hypothetical protein